MKETNIDNILTVFIVIVILVLINYTISMLYHPNIDLLLKESSKALLPLKQASVKPEPLERLQFIASVISLPFIIILSILLKTHVEKWVSISENPRYRKRLIVSFAILALLVISQWVSKSNFMYVRNIQFFPSDFFSRSQLFIFSRTFLYSISVLVLFVLFLKMLKLNKSSFTRVSFFLLSLILAITLASLFFIASISKSYFYHPMSMHFNPTFYPVLEVYYGKDLLVNTVSIYGFYPYLIVLLFKLIGLSVEKYTMLMSLLTTMSFGFLFLGLNKLVKNKNLLLIGFLSYIYITYYHVRILFSYSNLFISYFQYWPIRILFPSIIFFLVIRYFTRRSILMSNLINLTSSVAVLWNFDTGIIAMIAWQLALLFDENKGGFNRTSLKNSALHILRLTMIFVSVLLLFFYWVYWRRGIQIDYSAIFKYQQMFYGWGYFMLPMKLFHPWNALALIYILGLLIPIREFFGFGRGEGKTEGLTSLIFFLTVFGIGIFSYYQGRSHDRTLYAVTYPGIFLVILFLDSVHQPHSEIEKKSISTKFVFYLMVLFFAVCCFNLVSSYKKIFGIIKKSYTKTNFEISVNENAQFIANSINKDENIFIISENYESLYYSKVGLCSSVDAPSSTDRFFKEDIKNIKSQLLHDSSIKVFWDLKHSDENLKEFIEDNYRVQTKSQNGDFLKYSLKE